MGNIMTIIFWLVGILVGTLAIQWARRLLLNRYFAKLGGADQSRVLALKQITQSVSAWVIWLVMGVVALDTAGINVGALVAALGIFGLAISFGAQSFIKDIISYVVFVFADNFRIGEEVGMDGKRGKVLKFEMRGVVLACKKDDGTWIAYVPYSKIATVENFDRDISEA